jgi:hypothetical protein
MAEKKEVAKIDRMKAIQPKSKHARKTTLPGPTKEVRKNEGFYRDSILSGSGLPPAG